MDGGQIFNGNKDVEIVSQTMSHSKISGPTCKFPSNFPYSLQLGVTRIRIIPSILYVILS